MKEPRVGPTAKLQGMVDVKQKYQSAIFEAKLKWYKFNTKFLNKFKGYLSYKTILCLKAALDV